MFRANNFDKLLDKATSNLRLDPDWPTILQICDLIRQNDCTPKYAVAAVKKKLYSQNPHQAMFALLTLESIVKNCGSGIHDEVTSKAFCEMLRDLVKTTQHENLRSKILELTQAWAFAFRNSPKYRSVQDTVNILKAEGYKFPTLKESDAMFSADTAPEWADGEVCHRCRVAFSLMVRRHHCRACGQVFCQQCSSKTSTLPKFGIEKEVRVCDACYDKVSRPPTSTAKLEIVDTSNDYGPTQPQKRPPGGKTAEELQEEEELQLALALSQSEAEHKEKERKSRPLIAPDPTPHHPTVSPTPSSVSASPEHSNANNSELSRYLDRNYWERRVSRDNAAAPTAPAPASTASHETTEDFTKVAGGSGPNKAQDDDAQDKEIDEFVETLKSQVEIFVNRMKSNSSRGRSIANDTAVQTLFMNITAMHSRLLKYIQQLDDKRVYLESLQDKVTQIRDSRAALDTLRAEHAARIQQAAEAAERQRQMQMAAKLQAMRKKKHEYLQYQRQLALQRVQEQEREMQLRQEQQKHQYLMSANSYYMPGVSMPSSYQAGYSNQPMYGNQYLPQMTNDASMPVQGQPQISQANMPLGVNQMATIAQSLPQIPNTFAMSQSNPALTQTHPTQSMTQQNVRPTLGQQMSLPPMMMQQMHQMRMAGQQVGMMMSGNMPNGPPTTLPQQNGQKQNINQQMQPNSMMPPMSVGQQNPQQMINAANPMMGMQMQNMRMPQGAQPNQQVMQGYQMAMQQPSTQGSMPGQQSQMQMPGQMPLPGQIMQGPQMSGQNQIHNIPTSQGIQQPPHSQGQPMTPPQPTQMTPGQNMSMPGQTMPPGQIMIQGQQMPQSLNIPQQMLSQQQQMLNQQQQMQNQQQHMPNQQQQMPIQQQQMPNQQQQMPNPQQQMPNQQQQMSNQPQQMPNQQQQIPNQIPQSQLPNQGIQIAPGQMGQQMQGTQMPQGAQMQGQQLPHGQPLQQQGPQMQQGPAIQQGPPMQQAPPMQGPPMQQGPQGQPMKMPTNNMNNTPQPMMNQQTQQPQTPVKSEHNNNTAELISFD